MFNKHAISERGFSVGELLVLGAVAALASGIGHWIAGQLFRTPFVSRVNDPDFVRQAIGFLVGPAIFGGVARLFRSKLGHALWAVQFFLIVFGLAGGGATVVLLVEWLIRRVMAIS